MKPLTPYPDVNSFVGDLLVRVRATLGDDFVGMYFYGSLASGDFAPGCSDIDFLVVTVGELEEAQIRALESMHAQITAEGDPWVRHTEGAYMPASGLRRYDPQHNIYPTLGIGGAFYVAQQGVDWVIQRRVLRQHGWPIAGPPIRNLIDPVSDDELRSATRELLAGWWASRLIAPDWVQPAEYQAFTVLTMCRALHTLETGELASKDAAATWALGSLGARWRVLIRAAVAWREGMPFDRLSEVLDFIRFTLGQSGLNSA